MMISDEHRQYLKRLKQWKKSSFHTKYPFLFYSLPYGKSGPI